MPSTCTEARVEGGMSTGWTPRRPLWADSDGLHLVYTDWQRGIVRATISPQTGQPLASSAVQPCPIAECGPYAVARSTEGDLAISFHGKSGATYYEGIFLAASDGTKTTWQQPWIGQYDTMGLGWDGEGFTAALFGSGLWGTARFTAHGEVLADATRLGEAIVNFGEYDVETDASSGTTVFVGASGSGVAVAGRYGRESSLTAPSPYWLINGGSEARGAWTPAVAVAGDTALVAWSDLDYGIFARAVSLPSGQTPNAAWVVTTDAISIFKQVAATRVGDHWVVVGQDYRGLVVAEIGPAGVAQRRLLSHAPAACAATDTCPSNSSDWRWMADFLSVAAYGDAAWVGVVDYSTQRVENGLTLYTYRILPLRNECTYQSLASP
jgi:hypothetical protein